MDQRKRTGQIGEKEAAAELERLGYRLLARNYHCRGGEADLVAEQGEDLVFVEVKTRAELRHGLPRDAVDLVKQRRLVLAAEHFVHRFELDEMPVRFDVVEVVLLRGDVAAVEVIPDAFAPEPD